MEGTNLRCLRLSAMFGMRLGMSFFWKATESLPTWGTRPPPPARAVWQIFAGLKTASRATQVQRSWVELHATLHRSVRLPLVSRLTQHKAQADYGSVWTDSAVGSQTVVVVFIEKSPQGGGLRRGQVQQSPRCFQGPHSHYVDGQKATHTGLLSKPQTSQ